MNDIIFVSVINILHATVCQENILRYYTAFGFFFQQMKRKLDVVSRQLEVLYDRLRENSVSILRV